MERLFHVGDRVRHVRRPEWGCGAVRAAEVIRHEGRTAQRLVIDFAEKGRTTVNTAVAPIESADRPVEAPADLSALPPAVSDPLSGSANRLAALVDLFRFKPTDRGLIDWAIMRSGLSDPLSRYDRHELETAYRRFLEQRDRRLVQMITEMRQAGRMDEVAAVVRRYGEPIRQAVAAALKR